VLLYMSETVEFMTLVLIMVAVKYYLEHCPKVCFIYFYVKFPHYELVIGLFIFERCSNNDIKFLSHYLALILLFYILCISDDSCCSLVLSVY